MNCKKVSYISLIVFYSVVVIIELSCSGFIITNLESIVKFIKNNETFINNCDNDRITSFNHGSLYDNTIALFSVISILLCIIVIRMIYSNSKINELYNYQSINEIENQNIQLFTNITFDKIRLIFDIIFVLSIITFCILNITQFVFQLYNVQRKCIEIIDNNINGFGLSYNILECTSVLLFISIVFGISFFK
jgi:hypothetical protein